MKRLTLTAACYATTLLCGLTASLAAAADPPALLATYRIRVPAPADADASIAKDVEFLVDSTERLFQGLKQRGVRVSSLPAVEITWLRKGRTYTGPARPPVAQADSERFDDDRDGS